MTQFLTYFKRNTHRQVVLDTMAPPNSGPAMLDTAKTPPTTPLASPSFGSGTISGTTTIVREYIPDPPIP